MKDALAVHLGTIEYAAATALQQRLVAARKAGAIPDVLLLCEHPHVITLGRNGKLAHLRASDELLRQRGVTFFETDRGGDITYHGPGQLVAYPILDLAAIKRDVGWYIRQLEEAMIRASAEFGMAAERVAGRTGIWVRSAQPAADEEKLGAIGVHLSRWVTSHGLAYNVSTDLGYFDLIVPCGIAGKRATSLEKLTGRPQQVADAAARVSAHLGELLQLDWRTSTREALDTLLAAHELQPEPATA